MVYLPTVTFRATLNSKEISLDSCIPKPWSAKIFSLFGDQTGSWQAVRPHQVARGDAASPRRINPSLTWPHVPQQLIIVVIVATWPLTLRMRIVTGTCYAQRAGGTGIQALYATYYENAAVYCHVITSTRGLMSRKTRLDFRDARLFV